jgi:hypothetical protein
MYKPKAISSDVDTIFPTGNVVQTSSLQTFNITPSVIDDRSTTDSDYKQIPAELISL